MKTVAYALGSVLLYVAITVIKAESILAGRAFFYGVTGTFLIFCGFYISDLKKREKRLEDLIGKLQKVLSQIGEDPDPEDTEREALGLEQKRKGGVLVFSNKKLSPTKK